MANINAPMGFRPVADRSGAPYVGPVKTYAVPATDDTALFVGQAVKLAGSASGKYPTVAAAANTDVILGVIVGFIPQLADLNVNYRLASTLRYVQVVDDPSVLFEIQEDSVGGALTAASVGLNSTFVVGSGNTVSGLAASVLDSSEAATTNTLPLKMHGIVNREDNDHGDYAKWLVSFNRHQFANQVAGL